MLTGSKLHTTAVALLLCLISSFASSEKTISFAGDPWPPFFSSSSGIYLDRGVAVAVTKDIIGRIPGLESVFPVVPWKRALLEVRHGTKDGITFLMKNSKREQFLHYSLPVAQAPAKFFYSKKYFPEGFSWEGEQELQGLRIGIVSGYSYGDYLDGLISDGNLQFIEITASLLGFLMLEKGRIDLFPESLPVGLQLLSDQGWLEQAGWADKIINQDTFYIALSKKSAAKSYLQQINAAILEATNDGSIDKILNDVGVTSYPHTRR